VKSQVVPSHVVWVAPVGFTQAEQLAPQVLVSLLLTHVPPQLCVPVGQGPHAALPATQAPLQTTWVPAHVAPHFVPSQVAVPPAIAGHAVHDEAPHEPTSLLLTHLVPQRWKPLLHCKPQLPPAQTGVPLGSLGHATQAVPQALASESAAQDVPQG
jgi:hypothetical protein